MSGKLSKRDAFSEYSGLSYSMLCDAIMNRPHDHAAKARIDELLKLYPEFDTTNKIDKALSKVK